MREELTGCEISKKWGVPVEEVSCPDCGMQYGHHKTKVDTISELCSVCVKERSYKKVNLVDADKYVSEMLYAD